MSMKADSLIRLYPRRWRERYGEEFLATVGDEALHLQQVIDIVAGAIDAWLSSDVRRAAVRPTVSKHTTHGEAIMTTALKAACGQTKLRFTKRDSLIGAGVMLLTALVCTVLGVIARRNGWTLASQMLLSLSFPGSMMLSMPFTFMKGQPWRAQVVIIGGTLAFLIAITYISTKI
jgi:hypothetical protein